MTSLNGRHALVTGGSRGIGAAIADKLLQNGARVTLLGRTISTLLDASSRLSTLGEVHHVVADVSIREQVDQAVHLASIQLGPVDILINNAGQARSAPFLQTDDQLWKDMLDVNLHGTYYCSQAVLPAMRQAGWGRIVNVASSAGLRGYAYVSAYCAAKHGMVGLTHALALELAGSGVTINAVCPGYTDTPMLRKSAEQISAKTGRSTETIMAMFAAQNTQGRLLSPQEVAQAVVDLCVPEESPRNGEIINLDDAAPA